MIKKYLFEVNKNEKSRILKLHSNINEQSKYVQPGVNVGGKIIPTSKNTENIYYAYMNGGQTEFTQALKNNIRSDIDLNKVEEELRTIKGDLSIESMLYARFPRYGDARDVKTNKKLKDLQSYFRNIANFIWDVELRYGGQEAYNGKISFNSKNPSAKVDTRTTEQKRDDNIAQKNQRFENIKKSYCSVKNNKLMVGTKGEQTWDWYVKTYSVTPEEIKGAKAFCPQSELATKSASAARKKVTFKPNKKFPLRFGEKGNKISELQTALGIKPPTGNFYTKTEQFVNNKMSKLGLTYSRNKGVDVTTFNSIISGKVTPKDTGYEDWYGEFNKQ